MFYTVTRFTQEIDDEFLCSICTTVFKDAMQSPCQHLFCNECIKGWLAVEQSCPVECGPLQLEDLKPASRTVRNVVNKFEIKCDFESKGCGAIVKLENLQDHIGRCEYNGNTMVICDKGCDIEMRREEYETNNCFKHLADQAVHQKLEIKHLNDQVSLQNEKIDKQNDEVISLREEVVSVRRQQEDYVATLNDQVKNKSTEIQRLNDQLNLQENEISRLNDDLNQLRRHDDTLVKLNDEICILRGQIEQFQNKKIPKEISKLNNEFRVGENMKISFDQPVLKVDNGRGYAQTVYSLTKTNFSFKIEILSLGSYIAMGLATACPTDRNRLFGEESIRYWSDGNIFFGEKCEYSGMKWKVGDVIECGINFPSYFVNDGRRIHVYFNKNGKLTRETLIAMPIDGFFPTLYMREGSNVKYLRN